MTIEERIAALKEQYSELSKSKETCETLKNNYINLNNSLSSYGNHVNSALDFIYGAGKDCENGGFISGTQILGGDLIYGIQSDLENSLESMRDLNSFCINKMQEYQTKANTYQWQMNSLSVEIGNLIRLKSIKNRK